MTIDNWILTIAQRSLRARRLFLVVSRSFFVSRLWIEAFIGFHSWFHLEKQTQSRRSLRARRSMKNSVKNVQKCSKMHKNLQKSPKIHINPQKPCQNSYLRLRRPQGNIMYLLSRRADLKNQTQFRTHRCWLEKTKPIAGLRPGILNPNEIQWGFFIRVSIYYIMT